MISKTSIFNNKSIPPFYHTKFEIVFQLKLQKVQEVQKP